MLFDFGQLIAMNGVRFVYCESKYDNLQQCNLHMLCEIGVDDYGKVFATDNAWYFTDEELKTYGVEFEPAHWKSLVKAVLRIKYPYLTETQINRDAFNIVCYVFGVIPRFVQRIPKLHELNGYIAEYMNR